MGQQHGIPTLTPDVRTKLSQSRLSSLASLVSLRSYGQDQAQSPGRKVAALGLSITSGEIAAGDARSSVCASSRHSMAMPCVNGVVASCLPPLTPGQTPSLHAAARTQKPTCRGVEWALLSCSSRTVCFSCAFLLLFNVLGCRDPIRAPAWHQQLPELLEPSQGCHSFPWWWLSQGRETRKTKAGKGRGKA